MIFPAISAISTTGTCETEMTIDGWMARRIHFFRGNGRKPCVMTQPPHLLCNEACVTTSTHQGTAWHLPFLFDQTLCGAVQIVTVVSHEATRLSSGLPIVCLAESVKHNCPPDLTAYIRTFNFLLYKPPWPVSPDNFTPSFLFIISCGNILFVSLPLTPFLCFFWGCLLLVFGGVIIITEFVILYVACTCRLIFFWDGVSSSSSLWWRRRYGSSGYH